MPGITYDTGALVAAERDDRTLWYRHRSLIEAGHMPVVPAPVVAQAWRGSGPRQANLARFLQGCRIEPMDERRARAVGVLVARSGHDDVVDVAVVEGAARRGDCVLTSDPGDLRRVAAAADGDVRIDVALAGRAPAPPGILVRPSVHDDGDEGSRRRRR